MYSKKFLTLLIVTAVLLFSNGERGETKGPSKELPMLVTVNDLLTESGEYDGRRVVVAGRVQSIEGQVGRRGSEYVILILEEEGSNAIDPTSTIKVISLTPPAVRQGHNVLVQGVYHKEGRQAGRPFEFFIDAEVIIREKS
ncbi:MAG TPA: hypothetical protein VIK48_07065 [Candidatus Manganitrophaceae bacterium]